MTCSRGKAHPNGATKLKLFTDSAGFCQNPACNISIFPEGFEDYPHIAEMAHIFAATNGGPRTKEELSTEERGNYNNIILLCANCHTLADKAPENHPAEMMMAWKMSHALKLQKAFGATIPKSRSELRKAILPLLMENEAIHNEIGPDNNYRFNPEASEARAWKERVKRTIIPNSLKILMICDADLNFLVQSELATLEKFRFHVQGLMMRHFESSNLPNSRFPEEMQDLAK